MEGRFPWSEPLHVVRRAVHGIMAKGSFLTSTVTSSHDLGPLGAAWKDPAVGPKEAVLPLKH